jgi:hypothetical protein
MATKKVVRKPLVRKLQNSHFGKHWSKLTPAEIDRLPKDVQKSIEAKFLKETRKFVGKLFSEHPAKDHARVSAALLKAAGEG